MYTHFLIYSLKTPVIIDCMTGRDHIKKQTIRKNYSLNKSNLRPYISSFFKNFFALDPNQPVVR